MTWGWPTGRGGSDNALGAGRTGSGEARAAAAARARVIAGGSIEDSMLRVERTEGAVPDGAADLVADLYRRMPDARITDILLEVDDATRFTEAFTHLRTGSPCRDRIGLLNAIGRPTPTARRLVEASVSPNTRRAYAGALRQLDAWLAGREIDDASLTAYLAELHDAGRAAASASMAVAAACFRAKLAGQPTPAGERTARVLAGYRQTAGERGRGQARPFGLSELAAVLATCHRPRRRGRGVAR